MKPPKSFLLTPIWPPGFTPRFDSVRVVRVGDSIYTRGETAPKYGGSNGGAGLIDLDAGAAA